jgi:hypothetical protein
MRVAGLIVAAVFGWGLYAPLARAVDLAADAADDPAYANGWQEGDDGGTGWASGWDFYRLGDEADVGYAVESSTGNGAGDPNGDGDIDTGGVAWRLFARNGAQVGAERRLAARMKVGDTLSIDMDVEALPNNIFAIIDFATDSSLEPRMSFGLRDGAPNYHYYDDAGDIDSGVAVNEGGLHVEFTITGANTYTMNLVPRVGTASSRSGVLHGSGAITTIGIYLTADASAITRHAFFNSPELVPEPGGASAALCAVAGLGALRYRRRRHGA